MVTYKLKVGTNEFILSDISGKKLTNLKEIDKFTGKFENEDSLKLNLLFRGFITPVESMHPIEISYRFKGDRTCPIITKEYYHYLNPDIFESKFLSYSHDIDFLSRFSRTYDYRFDMTEVKEYIYDKKNGNYIYEDNLNDLFLEFFKTHVYDKDGNIQYSSIRNLLTFVMRYDEIKKLQKQKQNIIFGNKVTQITMFDNDYPHKESTLEKIDSSEKVTKKIHLVDEDEPLFPPNSEEEQRYNAYMEYQTEHADDNEDYYDMFYPSKKR